MMNTTSTFTKKVVSFLTAATLAFGALGARPADKANAASGSPAEFTYNYMSEFDKAVDTVNAAKANGAATPKSMTEKLYSVSETVGDDYEFTIATEGLTFEVLPATVSTGGRMKGATVTVHAGTYDMTAHREGEVFYFEDEITHYEFKVNEETLKTETEPFIMTDGTRRLMTSADMALVEVCMQTNIRYAQMMSMVPGQTEQKTTLERWFENCDQEYFLNMFGAYRAEAVNGVQNGWVDLFDARRLWNTAYTTGGMEANGVFRATKDNGTEIKMQTQEMTIYGLSGGFVVVSDPTGEIRIRFSFVDDGIKLQLKKGGIYTQEKVINVPVPERYSVVPSRDGYYCDTEYIALLAAVMCCC